MYVRTLRLIVHQELAEPQNMMVSPIYLRIYALNFNRRVSIGRRVTNHESFWRGRAGAEASGARGAAGTCPSAGVRQIANLFGRRARPGGAGPGRAGGGVNIDATADLLL